MLSKNGKEPSIVRYTDVVPTGRKLSSCFRHRSRVELRLWMGHIGSGSQETFTRTHYTCYVYFKNLITMHTLARVDPGPAVECQTRPGRAQELFHSTSSSWNNRSGCWIKQKSLGNDLEKNSFMPWVLRNHRHLVFAFFFLVGNSYFNASLLANFVCLLWCCWQVNRCRDVVQSRLWFTYRQRGHQKKIL